MSALRRTGVSPVYVKCRDVLHTPPYVIPMKPVLVPRSEPVLDLIGERGQALIGEWESIFPYIPLSLEGRGLG